MADDGNNIAEHFFLLMVGCSFSVIHMKDKL